MSSFAETMRRLRFERHMTQEEFADLLGTTKQNISRYESGAVSPKISTAQAYADKLGITLSELNGEIAPADAAADKHASYQTEIPPVEIDTLEFALSGEIRELSEAGKMDVLQFARFIREKEAKERAAHDD